MNSALEKLIQRRFGEEIWQEVRAKAAVLNGIGEEERGTFMTHFIYGDHITSALVAAAVDILGKCVCVCVYMCVHMHRHTGGCFEDCFHGCLPTKFCAYLCTFVLSLYIYIYPIEGKFPSHCTVCIYIYIC